MKNAARAVLILSLCMWYFTTPGRFKSTHQATAGRVTSPVRAPVEKAGGSSTAPQEKTETAPASSVSPGEQQPPVKELVIAFDVISKKALLSRSEEEWLRRHRRNPASAADALDLMERSSDEAGREGAVAYIRDTLENLTGDPPQILLNAIGEYLLAETFPPSASPQERQTKGADKGEIALSFLGHYPAQYQAVVSRNQNAVNQRIFTNAQTVGATNYNQSLEFLSASD